MTQKKPYLIANEITPVEVGEQRDMLPLHCTLVHWFWLDDDLPVDDVVDLISESYRRPVRLRPAEERVFTAPTATGDMPVRVTTVRRTPELVELHENICSSLVSFGVAYEKPEYVHEGYHPHITHQVGEVIDTAGYVSRNLYIATADRPEYGYTRTILAKIALNQ